MSPRSSAFRMRVLFAAALAAAFLVGIANADTILVTTTDDGGPDAPAPGSLRAALASANDGDTIDATGITGTITLESGAISSAELAVNTSVTILGPGPDQLTIDGNQTSRVLRIFPGLTVVIDGVTISDGLASGAAPGSFPPSSGGGIYNDHSILTVSHCVISGNSADEQGGGIFSDGKDSGSASLIVANSILDGNTTGGAGGAVVSDGTNGGNAVVTVNSCTISRNSAGDSGGGFEIFSFQGTGICQVDASTFSGNSSGNSGGAIRNAFGVLSLVSCTLSGNSADTFGGAVFNTTGEATVLACTFSGNSGDNGGIESANNSSLRIGNTVMRAGVGANIAKSSNSTVTSLGFNLVSDGGIYDFSTLTLVSPLTGPSDQTDTDPMLGPLADNGGPTLTHLPLLGSPAIDQGSSDALAVLGITSDQRGLARTVDSLAVPNAPLGDGTDIGAVEVQAAPPPPLPDPVADVGITFLGADKASVKQGEVLTYTIAVRNFGPDAAPNVVVNDLMSGGTGFLKARATKGSFIAPPANESGAVVWSLGDMANGAAEGAELVVSVLVKGKTTVTNLVVVNSDADDPNAENNVASITTSVAAGGSGGKKK